MIESMSLPQASAPAVSLPLKQTAQCSKTCYQRVVVFAFLADTTLVALALIFAQWLRFETPVAAWGVPDQDNLTLRDYAGHIIIGTTLMMLFLLNFRFYSRENLLSYTHTLSTIVKSGIIWFFGFLTITMMLKFDPPISRVFCVLGLTAIVLALPTWRAVLWRIMRTRAIARSLRQRAMVVGWSEEFARAAKHFEDAPERPFDIVGVIAPPGGTFSSEVPANMPVMGAFENLDLLLKMKTAQVVIVADDTVRNGNLLHIASVCEKEMVEFKLVPTCFRVLLSGLHLESVSGIPVLGISRLPLDNTINQYLKRGLDIIGSIVGLLLSAPIIAVFGFLIYRESPGSIFYRQKRLGANGRIFKMVKLRSMKLDAEKGSKPGWTQGLRMNSRRKD